MTLRPYLVMVVLLLGMGGTASAESHPSWWRYASPEATALVGIQWERFRSSPFAAAVSDELSGEGGLGIPDLDCVKESRQLLISSPVLLAMAAGEFPAATFREQAARKGLKRSVYRDVEIWVTPGKETLSIAHISDQLLLLGRWKDLRDAIDRNQPEETNHAYSPLLARAAHYAQNDLWVVATRLPDDLAGRFVPIDAAAEGFEGGVSLQGGLKLGATFTAASAEATAELADTLKKLIASLPPMAKGMEVTINQKNVTLAMAVTEAQLAAGLKTSAAAAVTPAPRPAPVKPAGPQIIRIYGLDDGPREIVMR